MRFWLHMTGAALLALCLSTAPGLAGHLQYPHGVGIETLARASGDHSRVVRAKSDGRASARATTGARRRGSPPPQARFMRDPECGAACMPPGQLIDFGSGGGTGPPGNLPSGPDTPVIITPLPQSAVLLLGGIAFFVPLRGRKRRRNAR